MHIKNAPDPHEEREPGLADHQEFVGGNRGALSGRNAEQNRAAGIDDPVVEGSRQGRERYKDHPEAGESEPDRAV
jgi:hypothetical protein